jgi:hypothetical protein
MTATVRNIFDGFDEPESFVVIPPNYFEQGVVPIFIRTIDDLGNQVYNGWIEAVPPIARSLRFLARTVIRDEWRVSELTEGSVHTLSRLHGERLGRRPSNQIYVDAKWRAKDMAAGGKRFRLRLDVDLYNDTQANIVEPSDFVKDFVNRDLVSHLEERLIELGQTDVLKMMEMYISDSADEIPTVFGIPAGRAGYKAKNTLYKQFRRVMRRLLESPAESGKKRAA